eukprot:m.125345 g.125345  ORF g.125345 m.125345 type:complete len:736 (-) comp17323_c0_seq1:544-2751(-)
MASSLSVVIDLKDLAPICAMDTCRSSGALAAIIAVSCFTAIVDGGRLSGQASPTPPSTPAISFNDSIGSYMVLQQQPARACVYGTLGAGGRGATIQVSGSGTPTYTVQANVTGSQWKACLQPTTAGGDVTITASCSGCTNSTPAKIVHATFGDVWYCGGQSNMALPLLHSFTRNASRDAILAGNYSNIRIHGMEGNMNPYQPWATLKQALSTAPTERSGTMDDAFTWSLGQGGRSAPCDPSTDSDCSAFMRFPAACYYFGESLSDAISGAGSDRISTTGDVPIGLINTAWGGSAIEQWLSNESLATCQYAGQSSSNQEWHDARVLPYVDMTIKGWTWYQGENDMHTIKGNAAAKAGYSCMMQTLIRQWRLLWSRTPQTTSPDAPFGIVTLASSGSEGANGLAMGAMRQAQTMGYGVLPNPSMPNTFLAQAYDLDDEWISMSGGGPCMDHGFNASDPAYHCCGANANASLCLPMWATRCTNMCRACNDTQEYMGGLHPRSKRPVGQRLARAAFNTVYGGTAAYTGPVLAGCTLSASTLTIAFNTSLLRGDRVALQPYATPNFTPYFHGFANPAFHSGSQLYVQTVASSFCTEYLSTNLTNSSSPVYCPTWAGGAGTGDTRPAPAGRFPSFGGSGMTPTSDPNQFNEGWINLPIAAGPTPTSITVDLKPLRGAVPTAVRYAWGLIDCCDLTDPDIYSVHGCIANCPIMSSSGLPANPFIAKITANKCTCVEPQVCDM